MSFNARREDEVYNCTYKEYQDTFGTTMLILEKIDRVKAFSKGCWNTFDFPAVVLKDSRDYLRIINELDE